MELTELLGLVTCLSVASLSSNGPQSIVVSGHRILDVIHPERRDIPSSLLRQRRSDLNTNETTVPPTELPTDNFRSSTSEDILNTTASAPSSTAANQTFAVTPLSFATTSTPTPNVSSASTNVSTPPGRATRFATTTPNITTSNNNSNSTSSSTVRASTGTGSYASITHPKSATSQRSTSASKAMLSTISTSTTAKPSTVEETSTGLSGSTSSPRLMTAEQSTKLLSMARPTNVSPTNVVPTTPAIDNQTTLPPANATTWAWYDDEQGLSDFQKTVMIVSFSIIGVLFLAGFIVRIWNRWNKAQLERRENEREWRRKSHKNAQFERRASGASRTSSVNSRQGVRGDKPVTVDTVALETTKIPDVEDSRPYTVVPQLHIPDQCVTDVSEPASERAQTRPDESAYYAKPREDTQEEPAESSETESMADAKRRVDSLRDDTSPLLRRDSNQVSAANNDSKDATLVSKDNININAAQSRENRSKLEDKTKKKGVGNLVDSKIDEAPKRERIPSSSDVKVRSLHFPAKSPGGGRDPKMSIPEGPKWLYHHGSLPLDMKKLPPEFFEELGISPQALFEPVERLNLQEIWKPMGRTPAPPIEGHGSFRRSLAENLPPEHEDREVLKDTYEDETGMMSTEL
ncbi:PREDICTED: uncharacterized protein LOC109480131 [Branchiostoma belcheri]|uniref:Uncharacterized protein LOC109480131 n=1 Tax=Branchiostoma belcheri TaxID=7741 RepID=A0A6P4ZM43_BRABE|nr:PREDICTED: uncharacterized protein LOC109480131 [Branchiostoma belcheri]XP_019637843.1 PREDICTED: uncharacterized protein LOC109480131 [Branchiostoma belcheri]XP_019637844.1 PREDICTED: uncharacterized protein LOC109480131 [Branchiostoma belcheri]XP_019637845.1 PREDICTED: uncharacterized protein LOC109480131 [Branchiostoma belcheri]